MLIHIDQLNVDVLGSVRPLETFTGVEHYKLALNILALGLQEMPVVKRDCETVIDGYRRIRAIKEIRRLIPDFMTEIYCTVQD